MANSVVISLTIVFLVLILVSIGSLGALWLLRRRRLAKEALLPQYTESADSSTPRHSYHKRMSAAIVSPTTKAGLFADAEKREFYATPPEPTKPSALPQIQITFPEEVDQAGKTQSGRVVVLHMDEKGGIGMEPVHPEDQPPAYSSDGRFVSLDLERIGGLKEKEHPPKAS